MADPISKPAWRYAIGNTLHFGSFRAAKMTPFWDPNFPLPCGQLASIGLTLAGRATRGNDANFGDFGIMAPLDSSVLP